MIYLHILFCILLLGVFIWPFLNYEEMHEENTLYGLYLNVFFTPIVFIYTNIVFACALSYLLNMIRGIYEFYYMYCITTAFSIIITGIVLAVPGCFHIPISRKLIKNITFSVEVFIYLLIILVLICSFIYMLLPPDFVYCG